MPGKGPLNTEREPKKAETTTVKGTITKEQKAVIQKLIGVIGSNEQDVVGKILTIWLYNEGHLSKLKNTAAVKKGGKN
jgi:hypothetical protein